MKIGHFLTPNEAVHDIITAMIEHTSIIFYMPNLPSLPLPLIFLLLLRLSSITPSFSASLPSLPPPLPLFHHSLLLFILYVSSHFEDRGWGDPWNDASIIISVSFSLSPAGSLARETVEPFRHLLHVTAHPRFLVLELRTPMGACPVCTVCLSM